MNINSTDQKSDGKAGECQVRTNKGTTADERGKTRIKNLEPKAKLVAKSYY